MRIYATLGPRGTNHDLILRAYLDANAIVAETLLFPDLDSALAACATGTATHLMICAAHPDAARIVSTAQYSHGILVIDCFIAESQSLAILTRNEVEAPRSIALHPATRGYADLAGWEVVHHVPSTVAAFEGLQRGAWDSALTAARFSKDASVRVTVTIDAPRDAWLVLSDRSAAAPVLAIEIS